MKALIVDDSKPQRLVLGRMLRAAGYTTSEAADGVQALDRIAADGPFELALFDWNMPVMDGMELLRSVRARPELKAMQVLMVTTETELARVGLALEAGANEYLMKPFTQDVLLSKLEVLHGMPP